MERNVYLSLSGRVGHLVWTAAAPAGPLTTSNLRIPLAGTVFVPLSDGLFDAVSLSGSTHVTTQVNTHPPAPMYHVDPVRILINLDQVSGYGDLTGLDYTASGTNRFDLPTYPTNPVNQRFILRPMLSLQGPDFSPSSQQHPDDPIIPLDISFLLTFNQGTGDLTRVDVLSMSVP